MPFEYSPPLLSAWLARMTLGRNIAALRARRGWTLAQVCERVPGLSPGNLHKLETRGCVRSKYERALAKAFGVPLKALLVPPEAVSDRVYAQVPRHLGLLPGCVVARLSHRLPSSLGYVAPKELVRWERPHAIPEQVVEQLAECATRRVLGQMDAQLWAVKIGFDPVPGWEAVLDDHSRRRVARALKESAGGSLASMTLREVKLALRAPVGKTLKILAELEAHAFAANPAKHCGDIRCPELGRPVTVTAELIERAERALALPWLGEVHPRDIRFWYPSDAPVHEWIRAQLAQRVAPSRLPQLIGELLQADKLTAEAEARALIAAAVAAGGSGGGPACHDRLEWVCCERYLGREGQGRPADELAAILGVTPGRVRHMVAPVVSALRDPLCAAPALQRALRAALNCAPCRVDEVDSSQPMRLLMGGAGILALLTWHVALRRGAAPVVLARVAGGVNGEANKSAVVVPAPSASWLSVAFRLARKDMKAAGCTTVRRVLDLMWSAGWPSVRHAELEGALVGAPGFRWLDSQQQWFTAGDTRSCRFGRLVRKMQAVARQPLLASSVAAAFDAAEWRVRGRGAPRPPTAALEQLLGGWRSFRIDERGLLLPNGALGGAGVLGKTEATAVRVVESFGGVATGPEVVAALVGQLGLTQSRGFQLLSTPLFVQVAPRVFAIAGRNVDAEALARALHRQATAAAHRYGRSAPDQ